MLFAFQLDRVKNNLKLIDDYLDVFTKRNEREQEEISVELTKVDWPR